jgi:hypothetical protein
MRYLTKILLFFGICGLLAACDELGWNPLDTSEAARIAQMREGTIPILLQIDVPTLTDGASFYDEQWDRETDVLKRRRTWRGPPGNDVSASLLELRHKDGTPMGDAPTPEEATRNWDILAQRELVFQDLYSSRNAVGPVLWRRFTMGPNICVSFAQGYSPDGDIPARHLLGYYCAPAGEAFSDGQAETVVRAIRVQEGDPALSPDG